LEDSMPLPQDGPDQSIPPLPATSTMAAILKCANCGESPATALLSCARCQLVRYCGKTCQSIHWKKGGHKEICKASTMGAVMSVPQLDAVSQKSAKEIDLAVKILEVIDAVKKNDIKKLTRLFSNMDPSSIRSMDEV
jgi:hypothetical protein